MNHIFSNLDISSRQKRRRLVALISSALVRVRDEEQAYRDRIPPNLDSSDFAANADDSIDLLSDAILFLDDAY